LEIFFKTGIILILSIPLGHLAVRFKLPRILGFIAGGIILGPYTFNVIDENFLKTIEPFYIFSLSYILFLLGTKLKIKRISEYVKPIFIAFLFQGVLNIVTIFLLGFFLTKNFILSLIFAVIGLSKAPATALAVIDEYEAEGDFSKSVLFLMTINDIFVILLFSILFPIIGAESSKVFNQIYISLLKFFGSALIGIISGFVLSYLEARTENDLNLTFSAIGTILTVFGLLEFFKMSPYIGAIFLGFVVSNASIKHKRVLKNLEFFDNLVYVLFFFLAGAGMHLDLLVFMLPFVIIYVILRGFSTYIGTYIGALKGGYDRDESKNLGFSLLPQAGLAIGFAVLIGITGDESAIRLQNTILASVIIFETIGVIFLRKALLAVGDIKIFHVLERELEPIFDFHFDKIFKEFLTQIGVEPRKEKIEELKVKHVMTRVPLTLSPSDSLEKIIEAFEKARCNILPVVDNEKYNGSILLYELEELAIDRTLRKLLIAQDLVKTDLPTLSPEDSLEKAKEIFRELKYDSLPVIQDNKIVGILLRRDIIRFL